MPSVLTHCWYGDVAAAKTGVTRLQKIIKENHACYMMGCQGPDPFFFYHRWPWKSHKDLARVKKFGDLLHKVIIHDSIRMFMEHVKEKDNDMLTAYLCGYLSHWAIDSACHPYIFYATDSVTQNVGNAHQLFEEQIDRGILEVNGLSVQDYQSRKLCRYPRELPVLVHEMLQPAFEKLSSLEISLQDVSESMKDFYDFQVLFHDPSGAKQRFVKFVEKFMDTGGLGESMFLPQKYDDKLDALNLRHEAWVHPCDRTMVSHESFCDLADGAVRKHLQILEALDQYLYESGSENAVLDIVGNSSFETGMEPGIKRQYYRLDGIKA